MPEIKSAKLSVLASKKNKNVEFIPTNQFLCYVVVSSHLVRKTQYTYEMSEDREQ